MENGRKRNGLVAVTLSFFEYIRNYKIREPAKQGKSRVCADCS